MRLADEVAALRAQLEKLERGPCVIGDWHRLDARAGRALVDGDNQLAMLRSPTAIRALREHMDEIHMIRMCAQHVLEATAVAQQSGHGS